jgi:hypothetical protein
MNHSAPPISVSFARPDQQLHEQLQLDLVVKYSVYNCFHL